MIQSAKDNKAEVEKGLDQEEFQRLLFSNDN